MRSIWITRHGNRLDFVDPEWAKDADFPLDPPLSSDGAEQARQSGVALQGKGIARIVSSPFLRCTQTADIIARILDVPIVLEAGLGEWLNPVWFPAPPELVGSNRPNRPDSRIEPEDVSLVHPDYPETKAEMYRRVARTARRLIEARTGDELWVGHGASVQGSVAALLGIGASKADGVFTEVPCCCLTQLVEERDGWKMKLVCDTSHLSEVTAGDRFA